MSIFTILEDLKSAIEGTDIAAIKKQLDELENWSDDDCDSWRDTAVEREIADLICSVNRHISEIERKMTILYLFDISYELKEILEKNFATAIQPYLDEIEAWHSDEFNSWRELDAAPEIAMIIIKANRRIFEQEESAE